ncbi:DNA repair protein [Erythrobacter insulae]|uniref:DNA repair protein n=1 Tax=Erythrobacter insulae TaxID=2584124 RepID=A0A547PCC3_9SPHN|nr:JAB domain-containing protein [Erythrobacter insulae]TRD11788.1 DNA repair protein [Erythrobacter insulae]
MSAVLDRPNNPTSDLRNQNSASMIDYLRRMILTEPVERERFHAIFLDGARTYLSDTQLGAGGSAFLSVRMRDLFGLALGLGAQGLIVAHNHPSGDCRPSRLDIEATKRMNEIATALDIELIDHLIITDRALYSMRAGGHM